MQLLDLLDIATRARVADAITDAIATTFVQDQARQTDSAVKQRFEICLKLAEAMRNDLHWSWTRICDTLPSALRAMLDNGEWVPSERNAWHTTSSGLIVPPTH